MYSSKRIYKDSKFANLAHVLNDWTKEMSFSTIANYVCQLPIVPMVLVSMIVTFYILFHCHKMLFS